MNEVKLLSDEEFVEKIREEEYCASYDGDESDNRPYIPSGGYLDTVGEYLPVEYSEISTNNKSEGIPFHHEENLEKIIDELDFGTVLVLNHDVRSDKYSIAEKKYDGWIVGETQVF